MQKLKYLGFVATTLALTLVLSGCLHSGMGTM